LLKSRSGQNPRGRLHSKADKTEKTDATSSKKSLSQPFRRHGRREPSFLLIGGSERRDLNRAIVYAKISNLRHRSIPEQYGAFSCTEAKIKTLNPNFDTSDSHKPTQENLQE